MKIRSMLMAGALSALLAVPGQAQWTSGGVVCGGQLFATCMSVDVSFAGNDLFVTIVNADPYGANFKAVGLINLASTAGISGVKTTTPPTGDWGEVSDLNGAGLPGLNYAIGPNSAPNTNGLLNGTSGTFKFTFAGPLTAQQVANIGVGVHAISGPNGCSTKFGVLSTGVVDNADPDGYARCGTTTVPEPVTMVLMGTGLAGIAAARRRRNGLELVDENGQDIEV